MRSAAKKSFQQNKAVEKKTYLPMKPSDIMLFSRLHQETRKYEPMDYSKESLMKDLLENPKAGPRPISIEKFYKTKNVLDIKLKTEQNKTKRSGKAYKLRLLKKLNKKQFEEAKSVEEKIKIKNKITQINKKSYLLTKENKKGVQYLGRHR